MNRFLIVAVTVVSTLLNGCSQERSGDHPNRPAPQSTQSNKPKAEAPRRETWRSDWTAFVSEVSNVLQTSPSVPAKPDTKLGAQAFRIDAKAGANTLQGQLFNLFTGAVHWRGTVHEYSAEELGVKMSESELSLPKGFTIGNVVWVKLEPGVARAVKPGDGISFQAFLQRPTDDNPFSGRLVIGSDISLHLVNGPLD